MRVLGLYYFIMKNKERATDMEYLFESSKVWCGIAVLSCSCHSWNSATYVMTQFRCFALALDRERTRERSFVEDCFSDRLPGLVVMMVVIVLKHCVILCND